MTQPQRRHITTDMTKGSPTRLILRFAVPIFLGNLLQQVYTLSDTMIAGHFLGDSALAAIGSTGSLYSLMLGFATGLSNGCGIVVARVFGMRDEGRLRNATAIMLLVNFVVGVVLSVTSAVFARPLLRLLQTPEAVFEQAYAYVIWIFGGMAVTILYNMCAGYLRALGNSRTPLYFLMLSCGVNLVLDVLLIVVMHAGVAGTAIATVLAQGLSMVLCMRYIVRRMGSCMPRRGEWRPEKRLLREMTATGLSMGLMSSVYAIGSVIMQGAINGLGEAVITAHTGARRLLEVLTNPLSTLGQSGATFDSQNRGAGRDDRVGQGIRATLTLACIWSLVGMTLAYTLGGPAVRLLLGTGNPQIVDMAVMNLRINGPMFFPLGFLLVLRNAMQALDMRVMPVVSSGIELVMKVLCAILIVPTYGYLGASWAEPSTWLACGVFLTCVFFIRWGRRGRKAA